jgi:hypothetical protein
MREDGNTMDNPYRTHREGLNIDAVECEPIGNWLRVVDGNLECAGAYRDGSLPVSEEWGDLTAPEQQWEVDAINATLGMDYKHNEFGGR